MARRFATTKVKSPISISRLQKARNSFIQLDLFVIRDRRFYLLALIFLADADWFLDLVQMNRE